MAIDLHSMRQEYSKRELKIEDLPHTPLPLFQKWFEEACQEKMLEPNACSLATVGKNGAPHVRTVLMKQFDESGFVFFTNFSSRKATHISENTNVSLLFPWIAMQRQVIVAGTAEKISTAESLAYFVKRPVDSQLAAWASPQSHVITSRKLIEMKWEEMKQKFKNGDIPLPSFWGGYRVKPRTIEFWQGRESRLHDRFEYTHQVDGTWKVDRLAP